MDFGECVGPPGPQTWSAAAHSAILTFACCTSEYSATAEVLKGLPVARAYLDGELCAVRADGTTSFSLSQVADAPSSAIPASEFPDGY
jgi:hypothetical protein